VARSLAQPRLSQALSLISAAVVGVIVNLSLWFTLTLLFTETRPSRFGLIPDLTSLDPKAALLCTLACLGLLVLRLPLLATLSISAATAVVFGWL
jgi:chromate transporter